MIPTFVFGWPTGKETGDFLALDLGTFYTLPLPCDGRHYPPLNLGLFTQNPTDTLTLRWHKPPCVPGDPTGLWQV